MNAEIKAYQSTILNLRQKVKYKNRPSREELFKLSDECRFKNGRINYLKLGKYKLGISHVTAKKWCNEYGIS